MSDSGISADNRADFQWIHVDEVASDISKWFGAVIKALPFDVGLSYFKDDNGNEIPAIEASGDLSIGNRISFLRKLTDLNTSTSKSIAKFFPSVSLGGAVSLEGDDIKDALRLEIGLPSILSDALEKWEDSLTISGKAEFKLDPSATMEVHDSTNSNDPTSAIDTVTKYSVGVSFAVKDGTVATGSLSYESAMRTIHVNIDGVVQTVVAERRTVSIDADVTAMEALGLSGGDISDGGTWYFYNFNTRQPVPGLSYDAATNSILLSGVDITSDIKAIAPGDPNAVQNFNDIVVVGHRTLVPDPMTGTSIDGKSYYNVSAGRGEVTGDDGTKVISVGARGPDQASSILSENKDGTRDLLVSAPGDVFGNDGQTYVVHIDRDGVSINGVVQTGDLAKAFSQYADTLESADRDASPPVIYATASGIGFQGSGSSAGRRTEYQFVNGVLTGKQIFEDGASYWVDIKFDSNGNPIQTDIHFANKPFPIEFSSAGAAVGEVLGSYLARGDLLTSVVYSSTLKTLGDNFGDAVDGIVGGEGLSSAFDDAFGTFSQELVGNLKAAGLGAISSFLAAELAGALGIHGVAGQITTSASSFAINSILANITSGTDPFAGFSPENVANIESFAGAFVGTQLANAIADWDEVGEQIGASIGSSIGATAGTAILPGIGTAIGAFIGDLIGGLIGGLFTGKPESGAIVSFSSSTGEFFVASVWKRDGGKKAVAQELGEAAVNSLNGIIEVVGGTVINGANIEGGSYGMRSKSYIYWNDGVSSDNRIKFDTPQDLLNYGVMKAAEQFQFLGGDIFAKRAFYNTISRGIITSAKPDAGDANNNDGGQQDIGDFTTVDFGLDLLLGNLSVAQRLEIYLKSANEINALMAAEPASIFTADWMLALSQASDLGLLKRSIHDWDGGLSFFFKAAEVDARDVSFSFEKFAHGVNGERTIYFGSTVIGDTIDSASKTTILGGAGNDYLTESSGGARNDTRDINSPSHIANVFQGGSGDDTIFAGSTGDDLFGGDGDDILVGGALDDWLIGGTGDDVLDAGSGNANVLSGGDGDDFLVGADSDSSNSLSNGSDWLQGDDGADRITGLGGNDYLDGGQGDDELDGGAGSDTIIFRKGDGHDRLSDTGSSSADHDILEMGYGLLPSDISVVARSSGVDLSLFIGDMASSDRIDLVGGVTNLNEGLEEVSFVDGDWNKSDITRQVIYAKTAGSTVQGTSANETLSGTIYDDALNGGGGQDTLNGGEGSDTYKFNRGDGVVAIDDIGSLDDLDVLVFGAGILPGDISVSHSATSPQDIVLTVGTEGDTVILRHQSLSDGSQSIEEVRFQDGTSLSLRDLENMAASTTSNGNDVYLGFDSDDTVYGGDGDDVLTGGAGDDNLIGGNGADTYVYNLGDGNDRIQDSDAGDYWGYVFVGSNTIRFGAGISADDLIFQRDLADAGNLRITFRNAAGSILVDDEFTFGNWGQSLWNGIDTLIFADGASMDRATIVSKLLPATFSDLSDVVNGYYLNDTIDAKGGNDIVYGGDGDDIITGGAGDDNLMGGRGSDTYIYNLGDGNDRIQDSDAGSYWGYDWAGTNTIQFGAGITADDLIFQRDQADGNNLRITFRNASGSILIDDEFTLANYAQNLWNGVDTLVFADGTTMDRATIVTKLLPPSYSDLNDVINGWGAPKAIDAKGGNDTVYGSDGDDTIMGGTGDDNLMGGRGSDTYVYNLGDGNDRIQDSDAGSYWGYDWAGTNTIQFGAGFNADDLIFQRDQADGNNLRITFRNAVGSILIDDQFTLANYAQNLWNGIDTLVFADGTSIDRATIVTKLLPPSYSDLNDVINGWGAPKAIDAKGGNDTVYGSDGDDTIMGGTGDDNLMGGRGSDTYVYNLGDGNDRIQDSDAGSYWGYDWAGTNTIQFGAGITADDLIFQRDQADGNNLRITFRNAVGSILVDDEFTTANYGQNLWNGIDTLVFADGTTMDRATIVTKLLPPSFSDLNDVINGWGAPKTIDAQSGNDTVYGSDGDDVVVGGTGDDNLMGGRGSDTYVYNLGDGNDRIQDTDAGSYWGYDWIGSNTIQFGAGISAADLILEHDQADWNNLRITFRNAAGSILINDEFSTANYGQNLWNGIDTFLFDDGTSWDRNTISTVTSSSVTTIYSGGVGDDLIGTAGADHLVGDWGNSFASGAGDDRMDGGSWNDLYYYNLGDGRDVILDTGGADTVRFGAGILASDLVLTQATQDSDVDGVIITIRGTDDQLHIIGQDNGGNTVERFEFADGTVWTDADLRQNLYAQILTPGDDIVRGTGWDDVLNGQAGNDQLVGLDGNDVLTGGAGADFLDGGNGNDQLAGGTGDDRMNGGGGGDVYLYNLGDGRDVIQDDWGSDTVRFGAGILASHLVLTQVTQDGDVDGVMITIRGTDDQLHIIGQDNGGNTIERFEFADGTVWTDADLRQHLYAQILTPGDDIVRGTGWDDVLNGQAGNDQLVGLDGNDVLTGGAGADFLDGGNGNDQLAGGTGDDRMNGGGGDDVYLYNLGDGRDVIQDDWGSDTVRFGAGILTSDLVLTQVTQDGDVDGVMITIRGTDDQLHIIGQDNGGNTIERFEFADGTVWTDADLREHLYAQILTPGDDIVRGTGWDDVLNGQAGNDQLVGLDGNDVLTGGAGADFLDGGNGNDQLAGGTGDDRMNGGGGDDVYLYNLGDGRDVIQDDWGSDTVRFGAGILTSDLVLTQVTQDGDVDGVMITIRGTDDQLHIIGQDNGGNTIERFEFADGTVWTDADLRQHLYAQILTPGDDIVRGTGWDDVLSGQGGDDQITGLNGNDVIAGGKGTDLLQGGQGDDVYLYYRGDGMDTIQDDGGYDTVRFGAGIDPGDIVLTQPLQDGDWAGVILTVRGTDDQLHIIGQGNGGNTIERFEFADGTLWTADTIAQLRTANTLGGVVTPSSMGNDTIVGTTGADILRGMGGDDALRGGMGSDVYLVKRGDGHDTIYDPSDPSATDRLVLEGINPGDVTLLRSPTDADDAILYVDDDTVIYLDQENVSSTSGIDEIDFADGTVWDRATIDAAINGTHGTSGNDRIVGTNFADILAGGAGNDTLIGNAGNDTYLYNLGDGDDTIIDDSGAGNDPGLPGNAGNFDTLSFGPGIALADIRLTQSGPDEPLVISFASAPGSITLRGLDTGGRSGVEVLRFSDGTEITMDQLRATAINGTVTAGDDLIRGFATADVLAGGRGNDTLVGGRGADSYLFNLGDGADTIVETADGSTNRLIFGPGISTADVRLIRTIGAPDDLVLALANGSDSVTVKSQFVNDGAAGIQEIDFADGTVWLAKDLQSLLLSQPATEQADYLVGDDGGNTIAGLGGDDLILGGAGNDVLFGSDGNDTLYGGAGDDELHGGAGDDILSGDTGTDTLDGGDGSDTADYSFSLDKWSINLAAGTARIVTTDNSTVSEALISIENVVGGLGSDVIIGDDGANRIRGFGGNDTLNGAGGDDVFVYDGDEEGVDVVDGGAGNDRIEALSDGTVIGLSSLANVELITAQGHADVTIETTDDADTLDLSGAQLDGIAAINLGGGDDIVTGSLGADVINAGDGDDTIRYVGASTGGDTVDGGTGHNVIVAGADDAIIRLASFQNIQAISGNGFSNIVLARTDSSEVTDLNGIAVSSLAYIDLAGGNDSFVGTAQADIVRGGSGDDHLTGAGGDDVFQYAGADNGFDVIDGGDGYDRLQAVSDGAVIGISSLANVEAIDGAGFAGVTIALGDGDDHLDLSAVSLTGITGIIGGKGNDVLRGSAGDDTFLVSGSDQGIDEFDGGEGQDHIVAGSDNTIIGIGRIAHIEAIDGAGHAGVRIAATDGNDQLSLQGVSLSDIDEIDLGAGDDVFAGAAGADVIVGGAGNDIISGGAGNDVFLFDRGDGNDVIRDKDADGIGGGADTLRFGAHVAASDVQVTRVNGGNDYLLTLTNGGGTILLAGDAASDPANWIETIEFADGTVWTRESLDQSVVPFTDGDDNIQGTNDSETLHGGAGNDSITAYGGDDLIYGDDGNDTIDAGDGNDRITGGAGDDLIWETGGDDTYVWNRGDGNDRLQNGGWWDGYNVLQFGSGISRSDVTFARAGTSSDITITIAGDTGSFTFADGLNIYGDAQVDEIRFADGTTMSHSDYALAAVASQSTSGDDSIYGSRFGDVVDAGTGNDVVDAQEGDDTVSGGAGDDTIYGGWGNDVLIGGAGNDHIEGGGGDDVYRFNLGDGQDYIVDVASWQWWGPEWGGNDRIEFGAGITAADVDVVQVSSNDLALKIRGTSDQIVIGGMLGTPSLQIEEVRFADGTSWSYGDVVARSQTTTSGDDLVYSGYTASSISGGAGNDTLNGSDGDDTLDGGTGDDTIYANRGNDVLTGGTGNDHIEGGGGDDVYRFNLGDGQDYIVDVASWQWWGPEWGGNDRIEFGAGITAADVDVVQVSSNDLALKIRGTSDQIVIGGMLGTPSLQIEEVRFADGTSWSYGDVVARSQTTTAGDDLIYSGYTPSIISGGAGNDTLNGSDSDDTLDGGTGDDTIYANRGNDVLTGGAGNDHLEGGGGDDVYRFNLGDGQDWIYDLASWQWWGPEWGGNDRIEFGQGITADDVDVVQLSSHDLALKIRGTDDQIAIGNMIDSGAFQIEEVRFADGTSWSYTDIMARSELGTPGDDVYYAGYTPSIMTGAAGNDTLNGSESDDTLNGDAGDDILYGNGANDILNGGAGNDNLIGGWGDDVLSGGDGNDIIDAGDGNDRIIGGAGDDTIWETGGDDTYVWNVGDGHDVIKNFGGWDGYNIIELVEGIDPSDIVVYFDGANLSDIVIATSDLSGSIRLENQRYTSDGIDRIVFSDGQFWDRATLLANAIPATSQDDRIIGTVASDTLRGLEGNDYLAGDAGDDTLAGDAGDDVVVGGAGNDAVIGGDGNDILLGDGYVKTGSNLLVNGSFEDLGASGDQGSDWGFATADMPGWTRLNPQRFESNYSGVLGITATDGNYWLDMTSGSDGGGIDARMDIVQEVSGLTAGQVLQIDFDAARPGQAGDANLEVLWNGQVVQSIDNFSTSMTSYNVIVAAIDGTNSLEFRTTRGPQWWGVSLDNVQLHATIATEGGNDLITGGGGSDTLVGGAGSDIFAFQPNFGFDTITDFTTSGASADVLKFDTNVFSDWAHLLGATAQVGNDLVITADAMDSINLKNVALSSFTQNNAQFG